MKFKKTTLPNGLRIITVPTPGNPAVTVMVMAEVGSNYELKAENGLSHFIEHMCFKGTPRRPSSAIVNKELDGLGAMSNAMTSEEFTVYYAKAQKKHWKKLLEILSDIYLHPVFPEVELEKERGVILQEISMYEDQPQDKAAVLFTKLLYGDAPAGRWIAGTKENVASLPRASFVRYHHDHYVAKGTVVVVSGDISETMIKAEVKKLFKDVRQARKPGKDSVREAQSKPEILLHTKQTDQTHMVLGFRSYGAKDKRNRALAVLSGVLGSGMSSRLWHKLREELGACYYVYSALDTYTDHGYLAIMTGIESKRAEEVAKALLSECRKLAEGLVSEAELKKVKDYLIGQMYLRLETTNALGMFYAAQEIAKDGLETPAQIEKEIRAVTAKDIQKVAKDIFKNEKLNLAAVGNITDASRLRKALVL